MAQHSMLTNVNSDSNKDYVCKNSTDPHPKLPDNPIFHDFLGMKNPDTTPLVFAPRTAADLRPSEPSPAASASRGPSSSGGRGPISTTSDLASDRQVGSHLEGVPFYGPRGDISTTEIHSRIIGSKRSISDSAFMGSYRDGVPHMPSESHHNSLHLMKTLRNGAGGERNRRSIDDEVTLGMQHPMRPNPASLIFQSHIGSGSRLDADGTKWERSTLVNIGPSPAVQCSPRGTMVPFPPQLPTNRFRDANVIPPNISQSAADEGSRTGIKGPGILSSSHPGGGTSERNSSVLLKSGTNIVEHEACIPSSRRGLTSANRQMTIFYGGQAHVFDDVHPNKADVIMALAGSNGGSWSTNYGTKSTARPINENQIPSGELDIGMTSNTTSTFAKEARGKLCVAGSSVPLAGSVERISTTSAGAPHGSSGSKGGRDQVQATDSNMEKKREV
ncbi:protein TIFY 8 isoform X2 [Benincasa hispida]|uniref:protein TIFY 8 isoform X2 n=1 Tax=Benincasa hispida TaxID=102211 RepID=UPI001900E301|nr:protein TIFY 8 isoform X2 [Benincasa hispida]